MVPLTILAFFPLILVLSLKLRKWAVWYFFFCCAKLIDEFLPVYDLNYSRNKFCVRIAGQSFSMLRLVAELSPTDPYFFFDWKRVVLHFEVLVPGLSLSSLFGVLDDFLNTMPCLDNRLFLFIVFWVKKAWFCSSANICNGSFDTTVTGRVSEQ